MLEWEKANRFQGRGNNCSRWSEKEVIDTLSDFALKRLSKYSLAKRVLQYSEGLTQIS